MSPLHSGILLLSYFSTGIIMPVLSLLLLSRGCTMQTLPLMLGLYSLTALFLEVPSGVFADWRGRKPTCLLSVALVMAAFMLLLSAGSLPLVAAAMVLWGASRAFSSGSLDALIIDACLEEKGAERLAPITAQLTVLRSAGIALGALVGGLLPAVRGYALHLLLRLALLICEGLLCILFLHEPPREGTRSRLCDQLSASAALLRGNRPFWALALCMAVLAGSQGVVDVYWQPAFQSMLLSRSGVWLGLLCVGSYLLLTVGGLASGRISFSSERSRWRGYFFLQSLLGLALLLLSRQFSPLRFAGAYLLFYTVLSVSNIQEQTLLNGLSDSSNRATVLSLASLACQLGNLALHAASGALVLPLGASGLWGLSGLLLLLVCGGSALLYRSGRRWSSSDSLL